MAHALVSGGIRSTQFVVPGVAKPVYSFDKPELKQFLWRLFFANPIGLAAGLDKNATMIPMFDALGFGFIEVGSVTAQPRKGNPRPRLFRLESDKALINRMGLNNDGAVKISKRIEKIRKKGHPPIGVNIAKTHDSEIMGEAAIEDFCETFRVVSPHADYITINISCPNTKEGTTFEDPNVLDELLEALFSLHREMNSQVPIMVKIAPPLTEKVVFDSLIEEVVAVCVDHGVSGIVATNTAPDRMGLSTSTSRLKKIGNGGLSGKPIFDRSTMLVNYLHGKVDGKLPIIGVGGIDSAESAFEKILAGASLVQVYTGLVYKGPKLAKNIKSGIFDLMKERGFSTIKDAVGAGTETINEAAEHRSVTTTG